MSSAETKSAGPKAPDPKASNSQPGICFGGMTPILRVADLKAAIDHYVRVLGFRMLWDSPSFASVKRDECEIFLCEGDQGHAGGWVWIGVSDVDAVLAEYRRSGAKIRHAPTNYWWAYEMQVEDINGNVLRIGSEPRGKTMGEWLDMRGVRWIPQADGGWKKVK
ncbi:MAG TPA: VOC family protein [Terriglobales bacterium]|nr:VOC family protein [Terriglobales bacterium]